MSAVLIEARPRVPLTRADLAAMPDDGRRYELVDGHLLVSPAPGHLHQRAVLRLARLLDDSCPPDLETLVAPFAIGLADDTELQPDVLVARRADITPAELPTAPVLAVEVLSPSTRHVDLGLKRRRFERAGTRAYWTFTRGPRGCGRGSCATARSSRSPTSPATSRSRPPCRSPSRSFPRRSSPDVRSSPVRGSPDHRAERAATRAADR